MSIRPTDPIIAEIRAVRAAHAARFDYDIDAIFQDIQAMEKTSGRTYVRLRPPRSAPEAGGTGPSPGKKGGAHCGFP
ncbi:MAG: hypothetical protein OXQ84_06805 [bacterium]|nr:hypothetical protein [bacterium]